MNLLPIFQPDLKHNNQTNYRYKSFNITAGHWANRPAVKKISQLLSASEQKYFINFDALHNLFLGAASKCLPAPILNETPAKVCSFSLGEWTLGPIKNRTKIYLKPKNPINFDQI